MKEKIELIKVFNQQISIYYAAEQEMPVRATQLQTLSFNSVYGANYRLPLGEHQILHDHGVLYPLKLNSCSSRTDCQRF